MSTKYNCYSYLQTDDNEIHLTACSDNDTGIDAWNPRYALRKAAKGRCSAAGGELDGPREAVLFCENAYLYEHSVIKLNSGRPCSECPTLMHMMHPNPGMHSMMHQIQDCTA